MSTDSTELTFVRCPSCRSLVPAISTRCRMCGASLEASGGTKPDAAESEAKKSGRIRQHTVMQSESELNATAERIREEEGQTKSAAADAEPSQELNMHETEIDSTADPLSAYIEEIEIDDQEPVKSSAKQTPKDQAAAKEQPAHTKFNGDGKAHKYEAVGESSPAQAKSGEAFDPLKASEPDQNSPKLVVESGGRRGRHGGLSFGKEREEGAVHSSGAQDAGRKGDGERRLDQGGAVRPDQRESRQPEQRNEHRDDQRQDHRQHRHGGERPVEQRSQGGRQNESRVSADVRREEAGAGKLVGWLVSYSNPNGTAHELREGKFFVTSSSIKKNDLVITHASVSMPHAMVSISASDGLKAQDLLSDKGMHLRRKGTDNYQRISDSTRLEHGDWIKFGEIEFLVSYVPGVGRT
ncbi:MAG: hypothetical protein DCC75_05485 [Proteobacteria bacterium]|nr:MAG: hypothetical protein DCC75_05485 [Pseudomonadota bacterium]